jgi:hypothetical protein
MNTSGKDQDIDLPLVVGNETYKIAATVYPKLPVTVQDGKISALHITNNNFRAVVIEK